MATSTKKVPTKPSLSGFPGALPWVEDILRELLDHAIGKKSDGGALWSLGNIATAYSEYLNALARGKLSVATRRLDYMRSVAELHAVSDLSKKYRAKRDALQAQADAAESAAKGAAAKKAAVKPFYEALDKLDASHGRAQKKALEARGIPHR